MVPIPAGRFQLGASAEERALVLPLIHAPSPELFKNEAARQADLPNPCYIDRYPVTVREFAAFFKPLTIAKKVDLGLSELTIDESRLDFPITSITWVAALRYAEAQGKRLPREVEWEIAAGWNPETQTKQVFPWGNDIDSGPSKCALGLTLQSVTAHAAVNVSPLGCIDMAGNAGEWCADIYREDFSVDEYRDISKQAIDSERRSIRGGTCRGSLFDCRVSARNSGQPWAPSSVVGFRCVMDI